MYMKREEKDADLSIQFEVNTAEPVQSTTFLNS